MRVFAVLLGVLYALAYSVPTILYLTGTFGSTGITPAGALAPLPPGADVNLVGAVTPGSPGARAGIVAGDVAVRVSVEHAPPFEQLFDRVPSSQPVPYAVTHRGVRRTVSVVPSAIHPSTGEAALVVAQLVRGIAIVLIGAFVVVLRPSVMTAAFYVLCLGFGELAHPAGNLELVAWVPAFWKWLFLLLTCLVAAGSPAVAAIFCMRFPTGAVLRSWRPVERTIVVAGALTIADYLVALVAGGVYTSLGSALYALFSIATWLSYAVATAAFLVRYVHGTGEDRHRLRWVAVGLVSFLVSFALYWAAQNVAAAPDELSAYAQFVNILPFTVVYAVVRHRVIDVRLAGARAVAYATLSGIPVVAFSLIDWGLSNRLQQSRVTVLVEIVVGIAFGFWVNASQAKIDDVIESVFFHARRAAEDRLRGAARRVAHAGDRAAVDDVLVQEPDETLEPAGAALFRRVGDEYVRVAQRHWAHDELCAIGRNDALALELIARCEPVRVGRIGSEAVRQAGGLPGAVALPIHARGDVTGILVIGGKRNRERFEPPELAALQTLVDAASITYDHLDAVDERRAADDLRGRLDAAQHENRALRDVLVRRAPSEA